MDITITVTSKPGANGVGKSHKVTLKDVATIDVVHEALDREMSEYFPKYKPLTEAKARKVKEAVS